MKQLLENLLKEWWIRPLPEILPRRTNLVKFINLPVRKAVVVVGFRRVGKTYLLFDLAKKIGRENCLYLNFEDERIERKTPTLTFLLDVLTELKGKKPYVLLLDEIQNIPNWSLWVRRVLETTKHQIFLSGSSSKLTSAEIPTELRGRSITIHLWPLSFVEYLTFKQKKLAILPEAEVLNLTREYLNYGGFPEVVLVDEGRKPLIIDEYFQTFLGRDLIERYKVRNKEEIKVLIKLLLNSSFYTASKLTNALKSNFGKTSKSTVTRYLSFLEESLFLRNLFVHSPNIKSRLKASRKPYFIDSFFLSRFSTEFSQNIGRLMEQVVVTHLWRKSEVDNFFNLYYWKDTRGREVDFVLRKKETTAKLLQVSFIFDKSQIDEREITPLVKAADSLACQDLTLVTWSLKTELKTKGKLIKCLPLWQFLLDERPERL